VLAALLALTSCDRTAPEPSTTETPIATVVTDCAVRRTMPLTVRAMGNVEAISTLAVRARVGGELTRVWFTEGQHVRTGDVLFTLDPRPFEALLREAEARLARDEALLEQARSDANRLEDLVRQHVISRAEYEQTTTNRASLLATVDADRAAVESARLQLSYCTIRTPLAGRTGGLTVTAGNLVKANDESALVTIHQLAPIHVVFPVPARFLPAIQQRHVRDLRAIASIPNDAGRFDGRLTFVDNAVDRATNTVLLKAIFPNRDETLWPGQFVDVELELGEEPDRVVVPAPAVQTGQEGPYVIVVGEDAIAELRPVRVSRIDARDAVIESGLDGGETVIVDGHLRVVPGARVSVRSTAATPTAAGRPHGDAAGAVSQAATQRSAR
jgi:multidrug efflux system membrane fusion protein